MNNTNEHIKYKWFILYLLLAICGLCVIVAGYNFYYDPLMISGFTHNANRIVPVVDARMQKTNKLVHYRANYDALLIGSSRVEQLRNEDFAPYNVFNYGLPSIYPDEYVNYIDLFRKYNMSKKLTIFLGFDFYGSNANNFDHAKPFEYYIEMCTSLARVSKLLLSRDTFDYSRKMSTGINQAFTYDRKSLNKITTHIAPEESRSLLLKQVNNYKSTFYGNYVYNKNFREMLINIKKHAHGARIIVFTTPESNDLFKAMAENGLMSHYEQWITDIVAAFGEVYNFMQPGLFASDYNNFVDAHHLFPEKSTPIVRLIIGQRTSPNAEFYNSLVTQKNLQQQLKQIRQNTDKLLKGN